MMSSSSTASRLRRFWRDDAGVALVEFAIALPLMLILFAVIIEGSRMMLSYQSAISGVRDATRYLARTAPSNLCTAGGVVTGYSAHLQTLVTQGLSGNSVFPSGVTVTSVTPTFRCVVGTYRGGDAAVAQVTATITITYPFAGLLTWFGASWPTMTKTITDQARIFGT